jgi:hypothetical protein
VSAPAWALTADWSRCNTCLADLCNVDRKTVTRWRKELRAQPAPRPTSRPCRPGCARVLGESRRLTEDGLGMMVTIYPRPDQIEQLRALHRVTKLPIAEFVRQGIDLVLAENDA